MKRILVLYLLLASWAGYATASPLIKTSPDNVAINGSFEAVTINYTAVTNWDTAVADVHGSTGVDANCEVTVNSGDDSLIDISGPCAYHVQGPKYTFAALSGIDAGFGAGENSRFYGLTMNGYTSQEGKWTAAQQQTIVPISRLNTALGVTGPGSTVSLVRDDRYHLTERFYKDRLWSTEAIGAKYALGGELFANATTNTVMGQYSGVLYDSQRERHMLNEFNNMSAVFVHVSSSVPVVTKAPFVVDNLNYDDGSGLAALISNRWTNISVLKSPQEDGGWFYIYGGEYTTQTDAEAAGFDFSVFVSQGRSELVPLASIIVKQAGVTEGTDLFIIDKRACDVCRP